MSVSEIVQRMERLEEHCKIEATKVAALWKMHKGLKPLDYLNDVPPSPATRHVETGVQSHAEPWKTYKPLPASLDEKALEESLQSVRERAISYAKAIDAMAIERESLKARIDYLERDRKFWSMQSAVHEQAANALKARVAELESAPAASVAANSPGETVSLEPDAWGVMRDGGVAFVSCRSFRRSAENFAYQWGGKVVPLFTSPPPAPGWLTKKDREWLEYLLQNVPISLAADEWIHSILARDTPPEEPNV